MDKGYVDLDKYSMADLYSILSYLNEHYKKLINSAVNLNSNTPEFQEYLDKKNQLKRSYDKIEYEIDERLKVSGIMDYNPFNNK